jgi:hypothetical protein
MPITGREDMAGTLRPLDELVDPGNLVSRFRGCEASKEERPMSRAPSLACLLVTLFGRTAGAGELGPSILVNEVLYDPDGSDGGHEFVELAAGSSTSPSASLAGWVLETGNGARPGEWIPAWIGGTGDRLRDGLFLIGESAVEPRPDAVVALDLQNGPDACRLRGPTGEQDRLGWGAPLDSTFFEGRPAEDVTGRSLARLPDGVDTNDNAYDFRAAAPSPGDFNAPEFALLIEEFIPPPADWARGRAWTFAWTVRNVGRVTGPGRVSALCQVHPGEELANGGPSAGRGQLAPGERARVEVEAHPPPGVHLPISEPPLASESVPAAWRGNGSDLFISEVLNRPRPDGAEWVEIFSLAATELDLAVCALSDAAGGTATLRGTLAPGRWAIATADTSALRHDWSIPSDAIVISASPWPPLNHTASGGAAAERVVVRIGEIEAVAVSLPGGASEGVSWETVSRWRDATDPASWSPSLDPTGATPGRPNSRDGDRILPGGGLTALTAHPPTFFPARDRAALVVFRSRARDCRMTVHDSSGLPVARLAPWLVADGEHRALWDGQSDSGTAAALGLYVVRAEAIGAPSATATLVLVR